LCVKDKKKMVTKFKRIHISIIRAEDAVSTFFASICTYLPDYTVT
jgi:hypothetical protein